MSNIFTDLKFKFKKHEPTILVVTGTICGAAAIGFTINSTLKVQEVIKEEKELLEVINEHDPKNNPEMAEKYTEEDVINDKIKVYARIGVKIAKLYWPTILFAILSETSFIVSNKILAARLGAMSIAFTGLAGRYNAYRQRVAETYGEKVDEDFHLGIRQMKIEEHVVDEDGKAKKTKKSIDVVDPYDILSPYAKFFDEFNIFFRKDESLNYFFLKEQREWAQFKLNSNGYLFLNDVYKALGLPLTKEGYMVGWIKKSKETKNVDFKMRNVMSIDDLRNGILIDFNVDGPIIDLLPIEKF